jgi:hypothetical protein
MAGLLSHSFCIVATFDVVTIIHFLDFVKGDENGVLYIGYSFLYPLGLVESTPG